MRNKIQIINGPNLNMLGKREPEKYGSTDFPTYLNHLRTIFPQIEFSYFQSNIEGEIVTAIQNAGFSLDAIIINPGGYSHTSVSIADAIAMVTVPVVEVHLTNLLSREEFRHTSMSGGVCKGSIMGFGLDGYRLAVEALKNI